MSGAHAPGQGGRAANLTLWALQGLGAVAFVAAGGAKLAGLDKFVHTFAELGWGAELRWLVGAAEVIGGCLLLAPRAAGYAAGCLAVLMMGALFAHLLVLGGSLGPAVGLLALMIIVAWGRRPWAQVASSPAGSEHVRPEGPA